MKNYIIKNLSVVILLVLVILMGIVGYFYFSYTESSTTFIQGEKKDSSNYIILGKNTNLPQIQQENRNNQLHNKLGNIFGGLFTGLLIAFIQHLILIDEKRRLDKIKALAVKNVLFNRDDKDYYRNIIFLSKNEIKIMGVTAYRLLNDFANTDSSSANDKVLISALSRNVKIKILLPNKEYLDDRNKANFDSTKSKMSEIKGLYKAAFDYKYFDHVPTQSIFNVDSETIIGPVIPGRSSKDTPAIHIFNTSKYAEIYMEYFNTEWEAAKYL
jgi:hypothetical protein